MPRNKKTATLKRKSGRKNTKTAKAVTAQTVKKSTSAAGKSRAEGIRLFAVVGRPSKGTQHS